MTTFYFVRHAKSDPFRGSDKDRSITEEGYIQAQKLVEVFKHIEFDLLITSPYQRAIDTLIYLALDRRDTIQTYEELKEIRLSNEPIQDVLEYQQLMKKIFKEPSFNLDDCESIKHTQDRAVPIIRDLVKRYPDDTIIVGTHGTLFTAILKYFDDQYGYEFWKSLKQPDIYKVVIDSEQFILHCIEHVEVTA
ncbi:histidine phosphatase family protein [Abyssicoccus albus]|uniref:histidine phosphatase family protein n=1 Tax=Abyssicoccus albus TaxID=1817405 RepID=UPI00097E1F6A|nr:histidine phosphatase family protein [Abyssicoccus albus]AQL56802.1 hypothetical protein BVH56_07695 [Abyssicoccus albus]